MLRNRLRGAVVVLSSLLVATGSPVVLTRLLEKAFEKDSELPGAEQNEFAELIPDVLESERRWKHAFGGSQDELERLADEALDEREAGDFQKLDPNRV